MNREEILEFAAAHPVFHLATADGDQPHVRAMMLSLADPGGLVFSTARRKDVCAQLLANPNVEMCFYDGQSRRQLRIQGRAEAVEDLAVKQAVVEKFPFLKPWIDREGFEAMAVFRIPGGRACLWSEQDPFARSEFFPF